MLSKDVIFFGHLVTIACDGNCDKAWGVNARPRSQLSDDPDDYAFHADAELGTAPIDPGSYEGGHAKPKQRPMTGEQMNKWCCRECERCVISDRGEQIVLQDFSKRIANINGREC